MESLIPIAIICALILLIYKLVIAIKNIFVGTTEIIQHGSEFAKIITKIGKGKIKNKIDDLKETYEIYQTAQEFEDYAIAKIMLEFNVSRSIAKEIFRYYIKDKLNDDR